MAKKRKRNRPLGANWLTQIKNYRLLWNRDTAERNFQVLCQQALFIARKFVAHTHLKQHGHFLGNFLFQEMLLKTPYTYKRPYLYNNYTIRLVYNKCTVRNAFFFRHLFVQFSYHKGDTSSLFTMLMIQLSDYLGL